MNALQDVLPLQGCPGSSSVSSFCPTGLAEARCGESMMAPPLGAMPFGPMAGADCTALLSPLLQLLEMLTALLAGLTQGGLPGGPAGAHHNGGGSHRQNHTGVGQGGSTAPAPGAADLSRSTPLGTAITRDALSHCDNVPGLCLKHVGAVLRRHGVHCGPAPSAYMVADQLAGDRQMKEIHPTRAQLGQLPAGAVIVWNRGPGLPDGHISIALGDGREWSGPIRQQMRLGTSYRVFLPTA